jgi:hypothetical protein
MLRDHAQWRERHDGRTALGLAGIAAERLPDVARDLQAFAGGEATDVTGRPPDVPVPGFIRWCADDLKALFFEAYLVTTPAATGDEVARWFWGHTATGQLLRGVAQRLADSDHPQWKAAAFGVAR